MPIGQKRVEQKLALVEQFGGGCQDCGYNKCFRALQFHHTDSSEKDLWSKGRGHVAYEEVIQHPERFNLLCANCHFEAHEALAIKNATMRVCQYCGIEFRGSPGRKADGRDKHCSRECFNKGRVISSATPGAVRKRIERSVKVDGDCWAWQKALTKRWGVPYAVYTTAEDGKHRMLSVRPLALFAYFNIPLDKNRKTRMSCGRNDCVNPRRIQVRLEP
jgi:hypothetical protein